MSSGRSAVSLQKARGETMRFFPATGRLSKDGGARRK
jgi:hypothetical protein